LEKAGRLIRVSNAMAIDEVDTSLLTTASSSGPSDVFRIHTAW